MDRLSPLDASFLHIEDDVNHMHIGSVGIFEGPPPAYDDLTATVGGRLSLVPRYRQRIMPVPLSLGRPVWVDDPHFNIEYHVRHTALPRSGRRHRAPPPGGPAHGPAPRPRQAPVGDLDGRGARRRPLGHGVQGPPLPGGRRVRHRAAVRHPRPVARRPRPDRGDLAPPGAAVVAPPGPGRGGRPGHQPLRAVPGGDVAGAAPAADARRRARARQGLGGAVEHRAPHPAHQPQRADRPPPHHRVGGRRPGRRQAHPGRPRRHRQRRRARPHHPGLPGPAAGAGRGPGRPGDPHARAGLGPPPGRERPGHRRRHA